MQQFIAHYGYLAIFVLMVAESACIPAPSELTMPMGGALASHALTGTHLNVAIVIGAGVAGNVVGSYLAWAIGRYGGQAAWHSWGRSLRLRQDDLARAEKWFNRYGAPAVFFGRLLPVVRTVISLPAGIAAMPPARFGLYTLAGCIPWTAALTGAGYVLGRNWQTITNGFHGPTEILAALTGLLIIIGLVVFVHHRPRRDVPAGRSPRP